MLTSYFMPFVSNEAVGLHGRCLEDCRFTMDFAQKHYGCATPRVGHDSLPTIFFSPSY